MCEDCLNQPTPSAVTDEMVEKLYLDLNSLKLNWSISINSQRNLARWIVKEQNKQLANLQAQVDAANEEITNLKECLEPGKASAIVGGLFREAERLGFYKPTAKHALTQFVEEVTSLRQQLLTCQAAMEVKDTALKQLKTLYPNSEHIQIICDNALTPTTGQSIGEKE